eukprot:TRINITY_DN4617_c0_g1_i4.p1 TRINITY_DN4617_c0_g1~~TRINITY_DN4617_c0_g1_i4.p1  ORF type:complete len:234 (-),score=38.40 TRINITY_DN4617_c0_g1_i4:18-719(-)
MILGAGYPVLTDWVLIENFFSSKNNYKNLKETMEESALPAIPYLGLYISDIAMLAQELRLENGMVHFENAHKIYKITQNLLRFSEPYNLLFVTSIRDFFLSYPEWSSKAIWEQSTLLEGDKTIDKKNRTSPKPSREPKAIEFNLFREDTYPSFLKKPNPNPGEFGPDGFETFRKNEKRKSLELSYQRDSSSDVDSHLYKRKSTGRKFTKRSTTKSRRKRNEKSRSVLILFEDN